MAGTNDHFFCEGKRTNHSNCIEFDGLVPLGTSGAIAGNATVAAVDTPFFTVTKVGGKTGRYTIQLFDSRGAAAHCFSMYGMFATVITASADVAYTAAKATGCIIRSYSPSTGSWVMQMIQSTNADAEAEDNSVIVMGFSIKKSSAKI